MTIWNNVSKTNPKYTKQVGFGRKFTSINASISTHSKKGLDDDCFKKVSTDALTKGLSKIGFSADVFLGMWDDNKYVAQVTQEFASNEPKPNLSNAQMKAMMKFIEDGKGSIVKGKLDNY